MKKKKKMTKSRFIDSSFHSLLALERTEQMHYKKQLLDILGDDFMNPP